MYKYLFLLFIMFFSSQAYSAGELAFLCSSGARPSSYRQFDKAYVVSYCSEEKDSFLGKKATEKATQQCEKWAKKIGFKGHFTVDYFTAKEYGSRYVSHCRDHSRELRKNAKSKGALNEVHFALLDGAYQMGGTLQVDNFHNQKPYYYHDSNREMAQWTLSSEGEYYCGFIEKDFAILPTKEGIKIIRPSRPSIIGYYKKSEYNTDADRLYQAIEKLPGWDAEYLEVNFTQNSGDTQRLYNMNGPQKDPVAEFNIHLDYYGADLEDILGIDCM